MMMQPAELKEAAQPMLLEESAGISAPLYDVIDVLFELQSRGIFRRQVCSLIKPDFMLYSAGYPMA